MQLPNVVRFGAVAVALLCGSLVAAQDRAPGHGESQLAGKPNPTQAGGKTNGQLPGGGGALTADSLGDLIRQLGHKPETFKLNNGMMIYRIKIQKDGITLFLDAELSPNGRKVWLTAWFKQLPANQSIPPEIMEKMLVANGQYGPCHFQFNTQSRQVVLALPVDNRSMTASDLQVEIDFFITVFRTTEPLWNSDKWTSSNTR